MRTRWQVVYGLLSPLVLALLAAVVLNAMPKQLIADVAPVPLAYSSPLVTPVAGRVKGMPAARWLNEALRLTDDGDLAPLDDAALRPLDKALEVDGGYAGLCRFLDTDGRTPLRNVSAGAVCFNSSTKFTVLFNDSWPGLLPGLLRDVTQRAVAGATNGRLDVRARCRPLPQTLITAQPNFGLFFDVMIALLSALVAAGFAIFLSRERTSNVKHLQVRDHATERP